MTGPRSGWGYLMMGGLSQGWGTPSHNGDPPGQGWGTPSPGTGYAWTDSAVGKYLLRFPQEDFLVQEVN